MFVSMDRRYELEIIRRSLSMLHPGQQALRREDAIDLIEELTEVSQRLDRLRAGLAALIEEDTSVARHPSARRYGHQP